MHVDERAQLSWRVLREFAPDGLQFGVNGFNCALQASDFCFNLVIGDQIMLYVERSGSEDVRTTDGDAAR